MKKGQRKVGSESVAEQGAPSVIHVPEGQICDYIDNTFRRDTPEEYVRQIIERRLVNELGYSRERIAVEFTLSAGSNRPRADIVIIAPQSPRKQEHVHLIVECKSEKVDPMNRKEGVEQLKSYMSICLNCEWGMWTNGRHKEVWRKISVDGREEFMECIDIPAADGNPDDAERPKRASLRRADDDNLLLVFRSCHNYIYATDGLEKAQAFFELLKLIFCKTLDEQTLDKPVEFYATSKELSNPDGQLSVMKRIGKIFDRVKRRYPQIFAGNDELNLKPRSLTRIVAALQTYSVLDTHVDLKGRAYEELVGANLRGDRGQFFTPRNVMKMAVEMIAPKQNERICDPACGTGGFLVVAMKRVMDLVEKEIEDELGKPRLQWSDREKETIRDRIRQIAQSNFFGFDISPELVKATKMNMVMNNDGSGNIFQNDSLMPPHEWDRKLKDDLAASLHLNAAGIRSSETIGFFDIIVTNPPFGSKIPISGGHILEQYALARIWECQRRKDESPEWTVTKRYQKSAPPEQLFIERCLQFLKPGGRMAIVLPDSILSNPGLAHIRQWLIENTRIIASIDLHADTFQPRNGTQTSILILQKKTADELRRQERDRRIAPYNIFMAVIDKIGHDKRGQPVFKRDAQGNEIWERDDKSPEISDTADGQVAVHHRRMRRILDDQTVEVPPIFTEWKKQEGIPW